MSDNVVKMCRTACDEATKAPEEGSAEEGLTQDDVDAVTSSPEVAAASYGQSFSEKKLRLAFVRKVGTANYRISRDVGLQ